MARVKMFREFTRKLISIKHIFLNSLELCDDA